MVFQIYIQLVFFLHALQSKLTQYENDKRGELRKRNKAILREVLLFLDKGQRQRRLRRGTESHGKKDLMNNAS